jgi:hypothetical protein
MPFLPSVAKAPSFGENILRSVWALLLEKWKHQPFEVSDHRVVIGALPRKPVFSSESGDEALASPKSG